MSLPTKLIIIGAPRSGTNMLRDALCGLPGFVTWPCDEINPVWRHGFLHYPFDDFPVAWANPHTREFIRGRFDRLHRSVGGDVVVEKTCANSLRVAYLAELLPEARFVMIHRDGADAAASAAKRWTASLSLEYTARKARFIPWRDVPVYAARFIRNRMAQPRRRDRWGPMTSRVADAAREGSIVQASAQQWRDCVLSAGSDLTALSGDRAMKVAYEAFVRDPEHGLRSIAQFLGMTPDESSISGAAGPVHPDQVGRGRAALEHHPEREDLERILDEPLVALGYPPLSGSGQAP